MLNFKTRSDHHRLIYNTYYVMFVCVCVYKMMPPMDVMKLNPGRVCSLQWNAARRGASSSSRGIAARFVNIMHRDVVGRRGFLKAPQRRPRLQYRSRDFRFCSLHVALDQRFVP